MCLRGMGTQPSIFSVRRMLKRFLWISGFLLLMIGVLYSIQVLLRQWSSSEQYAVWYDYLNQAHHGDSHDLPGGGALTVIENRTLAFWSDGGNLIGGLRQFLFVGFRGKRINAANRITFYSLMLMNIWHAPIERRFQLIGRPPLVKRTNFLLGLEKQKTADELFARSTTIPIGDCPSF